MGYKRRETKQQFKDPNKNIQQNSNRTTELKSLQGIDQKIKLKADEGKKVGGGNPPIMHEEGWTKIEERLL